MSENLLEEGPLFVSAITGPASLGDSRALLQFTVADGSDNAQLTIGEVRRLRTVVDRWIFNVSGQVAD